MRKILFSLFVALLLVGGAVYADPPGYQSSPGVGDILGQGKFMHEPHRIFRLVRYEPSTNSDTNGTNQSALSSDSVVIWDTISDDGVTITTTTTSFDSRIAGIIVISAPTPEAGAWGSTVTADAYKRNWTWLQTYGQADMHQCGDTATAATAGNAFGTGSQAGTGYPFVASTSNASLNGFGGFYYDDATSGASGVQVFIRCD